MEARESTKQGYLPQLDGLRAVAITMVVLHHFGVHIGGVWDPGPIGPTIFFILSGYFVTRSLAGDAGRRLTMAATGLFHVRRLCKLMPPLVILVALGALAGLPEFANDWPWHLGFATNFLMISREDWSGAASHLWSLSVQEQFYLLWPFVLMLCPRRYLVRVIVLAAVTALLWRMACIATGASPFARWFFLTGSLEAFAAGSLIALWKPRGPLRPSTGLTLSAAAWGLLVASAALRHLPQENLFSAFVEVPETLAISWLVVRLLDPASLPSRALAHPALAAMGRISFGIFLYHTLVAVTLGPVLRSLGVGFASPLMISLLFAASVAFAAASHAAIERPIQQWSRTVDWPDGRHVVNRAAGWLRRAVRSLATPRG